MNCPFCFIFLLLLHPVDRQKALEISTLGLCVLGSMSSARAPTISTSRNMISQDLEPLNKKSYYPFRQLFANFRVTILYGFSTSLKHESETTRRGNALLTISAKAPPQTKLVNKHTTAASALKGGRADHGEFERFQCNWELKNKRTGQRRALSRNWSMKMTLWWCAQGFKVPCGRSGAKVSQ